MKNDTAALHAKRLDPQVECVRQRRAVPRARDQPRDVAPNRPQAGACLFLPTFYAFLPLGAHLEANHHHHQRHGQARPLLLLAWVWV
jgi:hypothetical protein